MINQFNNHTTTRDTWIRICNPLLLFIMSVLAQQSMVPPITTEKLWLSARMLLFISITFETGRVLVIYARSKYPGIHQTRQRIVLAYILNLLSSFLLITISTLVNRLYIAKSFSVADESIGNLVQSFWMGILIVAPYEVLYAYILSVRTEREKELLQKENIQNQLSSLQNQVNPHFLFNSLNALSELTRKDPETAETFVLELSKVYRYLLQANTDSLTTLGKELAFMQSYLRLLRMRFGNGLAIESAINDSLHHYRLPPLTLQVLIENVVKHNEISAASPLQLSVKTNPDGWLTVCNTRHPKQHAAPSTGFGLSGIHKRYQLLGQPDIKINNTANQFSVSIPLIPPTT